MTTKPTPKTIAEFRTALAAAKALPGLELAAIQRHAADLEDQAAAHILENIAEHIRVRVELAETRKLETEFLEWAVENRMLTAEQTFLQDRGAEIVGAFRSESEARSAKLPGVLAGLGQKLSTLAIDAFGSAASREQNRLAREAIEQSAADAESVIQTARSAVRSFEILPTIEAFEAAAARVNEIRF